jgi:hypothetical protein
VEVDLALADGNKNFVRSETSTGTEGHSGCSGDCADCNGSYRAIFAIPTRINQFRGTPSSAPPVSERGSSALRGAADTVLALTDNGDSLKLVCDKQKDAAPFDALRVRLVPVLNGATCVAALADGTTAALADLTGARLTALEVLRRICAVDGAVTRTQWFAALPHKTVTDRRFYDVVDALLTGGLVERDGKKRFKPR